MKFSNVISFISGVISIFAFVTGYQKIDDLLNQNKYIEEKKIEISKTLNNEKIPIAFEISEEIKTDLDLKGDSSFIYISKSDEDNIYVDVKWKKKFFSWTEQMQLTVGETKIRQTLIKKFDNNDMGFKIAEIQISGIINDGENQYVCYLFGKIPYNTSMEITYYGVGYLLEK